MAHLGYYNKTGAVSNLFALSINRSFIDWTAQGCASVQTLLRQLMDGHLTLPMGFPGVLVCSQIHTEAVCVSG